MTLSAGDGHSDYIVYVDESGDHSLTSINPAHPYHLAMEFGLERLFRFMKGKVQDERLRKCNKITDSLYYFAGRIV